MYGDSSKIKAFEKAMLEDDHGKCSYCLNVSGIESKMLQ